MLVALRNRLDSSANSDTKQPINVIACSTASSLTSEFVSLADRVISTTPPSSEYSTSI
jgi:hypothetical protein